MAFYTDLCDVYDALFPVSDAQRSLFDDLIREFAVRRVVDAGCGSGAQLLHFARSGIACTGFDADPALAAAARLKLAPYPHARAEVGGFAEVGRFVRETPDLILCLGNSLVHVPREEARRFVADAGALLRSGGGFLVQMLNYDRLLRGNVTELPAMRAEGGAAEFRRRYSWEGAWTVRFRTELILSADGGDRVIRNDIPLFPIYRDELREMLAEAGFTGIDYFGDFARTPWSPESEALVCLARSL